MKKTLFPTLILTAAAASLQASVLINETWVDGERATQDIINNSMAWYSSASGANVITAVGSMTQNTGSSGRHILAYFTGAGSPVNLAVGEILSVNFVVAFNRATALGTGSNNFRVGLFDSSGGTRVSADSHGGTSASAVFDGYTGYAAMTNIGVDTGNALTIRERTNTTNGGLIAVAGDYTQLGSSAAVSQLLTPGVDYSGTYSIQRDSASQLSMSFTLSGGALSGYTITRTDDSPSASLFDMVVFHQTSNQSDSFTLKQVEIALVPEPSHIALLFGALCLAGVLVWRRRRV